MSHSYGAPWHGVIRKLATYFAFFCLLFWVGFPVYYMLITSFMSSHELGAKPPNWIPQQPTIKNYREVVMGETAVRGEHSSHGEFSRMMPALAQQRICVGFGGLCESHHRRDGRLTHFPALTFAWRGSPISAF